MISEEVMEKYDRKMDKRKSRKNSRMDSKKMRRLFLVIGGFPAR